VGNALGARIEKETVGELKPPAHHLDLTLSCLVREDDGLRGLRTQVVTWGEVGLFETGLHLEGLGYLLLVGLAFEASTHARLPLEQFCCNLFCPVFSNTYKRMHPFQSRAS